MTELLLACIAEGGSAPGPGDQGPMAVLGSPIVMMVLMFAVIYFMLIRPQQKRQKEQQALRDSLKRGDKVITSGGIFGTVTGVEDLVVTLEVAKDVRIRLLRTQVAGHQGKAEDAPKGDDAAKR